MQELHAVELCREQLFCLVAKVLFQVEVDAVCLQSGLFKGGLAVGWKLGEPAFRKIEINESLPGDIKMFLLQRIADGGVIVLVCHEK